MSDTKIETSQIKGNETLEIAAFEVMAIDAHQAHVKTLEQAEIDRLEETNRAIDEHIEVAKRRFVEAFGQAVLTYLETKCNGTWTRNYSPNLCFTIKGVAVYIYISNNQWQWRDSLQHDSYTNLSNQKDLHSAVIRKIGKLLTISD